MADDNKYGDEREVAQARENLEEQRKATTARGTKRSATDKGKGIAAKKARW